MSSNGSVVKCRNKIGRWVAQCDPLQIEVYMFKSLDWSQRNGNLILAWRIPWTGDPDELTVLRGSVQWLVTIISLSALIRNCMREFSLSLYHEIYRGNSMSKSLTGCELYLDLLSLKQLRMDVGFSTTPVYGNFLNSGPGVFCSVSCHFAEVFFSEAEIEPEWTGSVWSSGYCCAFAFAGRNRRHSRSRWQQIQQL